MADPTPVDEYLLALVACNGRCRKAERLLEARGVHHVKAAQLYDFKQQHQARYEELREQHGPDLEKRLTNGLRDTTMLAAEAMQEAVQQAMKRLEDGNDPEPAKTAALLATATDKTTRNMLALSGRPTQITETRNVEQTMRALAAQFPQAFALVEQPQLEEATVAGDSSERV